MLKWYADDFETSNSDINIREKKTRVWAWDIYDESKNHHIIGTDISTYVKELFNLKSSIHYFHNLKFDGNFLINYLLKKGFKIRNSNDDGTIQPLITDRLVWYCFTVYYNGKRYQFRDSCKKITGDLGQAAIDFGLDVQKGEIDYKLHRDKGYQPTIEEIDYLKRDCEILGKILRVYYDNGMTSLTNATDAMKSFKHIISQKAYDSYFPVIPVKWDDEIRAAYRGGFCYVNPDYVGKDVGKIYTYDVKSMYPSVMIECDIPYGIPEKFNGEYVYDKFYPLYIQKLRVCCELKHGHVPSVQTKSFLTIRLNYLTSTNGMLLDLTLTNVDLLHLYEDYDISEIIFLGGYKFAAKRGLFDNYIYYYFNKKETSEGAKKQLYKIFLNALYGKFAMMTRRAQARPFLKDDGSLKFERLPDEEFEPIYTAAACFITAWARHKLLYAIRKNIDNFLYCDTDSIHLLKPAVGIRKGKNLGDWAIENGKQIFNNDGTVTTTTEIFKGRYLGQKCYILAKEDGMLKKIAGAPKKVKEEIGFNNFYFGFSSDENKYPKFRMKNVDGGTLLIPTKFTIKEKKRAS